MIVSRLGWGMQIVPSMLWFKTQWDSLMVIICLLIYSKFYLSELEPISAELCGDGE